MVRWSNLPAVLVAGAIVLQAAAAPVALAQRGAGTRLHQIIIDGSDDKLTVTLVGSAELSGVLRTTGEGESKRLYIDLEGVASAVAPVTPVGRGALRQIRVGLFSARPLITRVVFDIGTVTGYRLEPDASTRGLRIVLESPAPRQAAPSAPYLDWFSAMERRVGILIQATSQAIATRDGGLPPLASEWTRVQREIASMVAPPAFSKAHALLLEAARLARLEAERGETTPATVNPGPSDDSNPRVVLARARAALPPK